jgi:Double zinc ribbon
MVAQKVGQGDQVLVQIGHMSHRGWRGIRYTIGVSIVRTPDGVNVGVGLSNWLDLDDPRLTGMLIGAVFFPPLLIFPLLRGIRSFALYEQIWDAVDSYCAQVGARQAEASVAHGVTCPRCGVLNHEEARFCTMCGASLHVAAEAQRPALAAPEVGSNSCVRADASSPLSSWRRWRDSVWRSSWRGWTRRRRLLERASSPVPSFP